MLPLRRGPNQTPPVGDMHNCTPTVQESAGGGGYKTKSPHRSKLGPSFAAAAVLAGGGGVVVVVAVAAAAALAGDGGAAAALAGGGGVLAWRCRWRRRRPRLGW